MSTRVIIERRVKKAKEVEALEIMRELRVMALHKKGYFCGETMQSLDAPQTYAVLSIWQRTEDWKAWRENPERKEMAKKLERLLVAPEKVSVYVTISFQKWPVVWGMIGHLREQIQAPLGVYSKRMTVFGSEESESEWGLNG